MSVNYNFLATVLFGKMLLTKRGFHFILTLDRNQNWNFFEAMKNFDEFAPGTKLHFNSEWDFEAWCDEDIRVEYLDGEATILPTESVAHESFLPWLGAIMMLYADYHDLGKVYGSNAQLRLRPECRRVADLSFVSKQRLNFVKKFYFDGAPDLVVEIVSSESSYRDWQEKYFAYEAAGVREYWIVDLITNQSRFYYRGTGGRFVMISEKDGRLYSHCLPELWFKSEWFFQHPEPSTLDVLRENGVIE